MFWRTQTKLKGLTPAIGASPNFVLPQKVLSDSNILKSIYANNGLLYFHTELKNTSNIPFDVDFVSFKIVDKKVIKRTAMQEQVLEPLRAQNYVVVVPAKSSERTVFALEKFTIPDDKQLVIEVAEKDGGRHQSFVVENEDIVRANVIDELSIQ